MIRNRKIATYASILAVVALATATQSQAQQTAQTSGSTAASTTVPPSGPVPAKNTDESDDQVVKLTPFEVSAGAEQGYNAATTLAGNRLNTELRDIGNAVSVVTKQFLRDTGAVDNKTLLQYLPSGEVGGTYGNFAGTGDGATPDQNSPATNGGVSQFIQPNQSTRVRGLTSADNTRDFFLTSIPWDGYNIDRVDFQRGPNSILFGQGSPAGIINAGTQPAGYKNSGELELRIGSNGSTRESLNVNRVVLPNELAFRVALLRNDEQYKEDPAYSLDKRVYAATRWEPRWLNRGSARTIFKANIEFGDIKSNNPRELPPYDNITPWFATGTYPGTDLNGKPITYSNLNRATFNPYQLQNDNTSLPFQGQMRPAINGPGSDPAGTAKNLMVSNPDLPVGSPSPWYNPWIGNFGQQFGSPLFMFNGDSPNLQRAILWEGNSWWGINTAGVRDGSVLAFERPGGVNTYSGFAKAARLKYWDYGLWKDKSLTDSSVFDFYNNLLDGPTKKEWQNFRTYNMSLAQTFLDDQIGIEGVYNNEWWKGGQEAIMSGWRQSIGIDIMAVDANGTADPGLVNQTANPYKAGYNPVPALAYSNGTPNPNVGRPYITDSAQFSNSQTSTWRESGRLTAFVTHDFAHDSFLPKVAGEVLGKHTITGLWAEDRSLSDYRQWQRYGTDSAYDAFLGGNPAFNDNTRTPNPVIYLGPSLASRTTASGANIPRITADITVPKSVNLFLFDSHWNKPTDPNAAGYVNPAATWANGYYPADQGARVGSQADNPANYIGWTNHQINVLNADNSQAERDALTTGSRLTKNTVKSKALVWQGHLWNNFLVGTAGIRKDTAQGWSTNTDTNIDNVGDRILPLAGVFIDPTITKQTVKNQVSYNAPTAITVTSKSWSIVAHLTDLIPNNLPVRVSLFMAKSENFQPFSNRVDIYGHALGAPSGKTTEQGILLETKDNKYSLKLNKYKTESSLQNSSAIGGAWFIGSSQAWAGNWVNRFEFNWTGDTNANAVLVNDPTNSQYNYAPAPGETQEQAAAREASVVSAWRAWQKSVNPDFYKAWNINLNDPTKSIGASQPAGLAVTEDSISKGYEIEFNAQVTRNWRLTFNGSKTDAVRSNIGGSALTEFVSKYEAALNHGAPGGVGDLRIWWGGAGNETTLQEWNGNIGSEYHQRKLQEGTDVPELRKWRWNAVSNYEFDHGILKGVNVGGGLRWESDVVIGYKPYYLDANNPNNGIGFDLGNPYKGPAVTSLDLWAGYRRKLTAKIDWQVQLNVRNANYGGDSLIPITVQPDGTAAAYRIRPPRTWQLTNTFRF